MLARRVIAGDRRGSEWIRLLQHPPGTRLGPDLAPPAVPHDNHGYGMEDPHVSLPLTGVTVLDLTRDMPTLLAIHDTIRQVR